MFKRQLRCDCGALHHDVIAQAIKSKPRKDELINLSKLFKIIGDPTRIQILWMLNIHEMCVCDIANALDMTKSSISHQLAILRETKIVKFHRNGKEIFYMLDDGHIKQLYELGLEHIKHQRKSKNGR